jgi:hypothetical protein
MNILREILNRRINLDSPKGKQLLKIDISQLLTYMDTLTPYPWTPKQCMNIKKSNDLEFISKSPLVIEMLCGVILKLLQQEQEGEKLNARSI